MTMFAGVDDDAAQSASRMHITPRGVVAPGLSEWGETLSPQQAVREGCERAEVRLSLYLCGDDLLAGLWEVLEFWEEGGIEGLSDDVIRWHVMSALLMAGGPGSPQVAEIARDARAGHDSPEFATACRLIDRAFGLKIV